LLLPSHRSLQALPLAETRPSTAPTRVTSLARSSPVESEMESVVCYSFRRKVVQVASRSDSSFRTCPSLRLQTDPECCDGSDEPDGVCPNICSTVGQEYRAKRDEERKKRKTVSPSFPFGPQPFSPCLAWLPPSVTDPSVFLLFPVASCRAPRSDRPISRSLPRRGLVWKEMSRNFRSRSRTRRGSLRGPRGSSRRSREVRGRSWRRGRARVGLFTSSIIQRRPCRFIAYLFLVSRLSFLLFLMT
jgi:hypothetical protein